MKPRDRILTVLQGGIPDQVPWMEISIDETIQASIMGEGGFEPGDLCEKLGMSAFGCRFPIGGKAAVGGMSGSASKNSYYFPEKVSFDFFPPFIAEKNISKESGHAYVGKGLLTSWESLKLFEEHLPDPDHPARYEQVAKWISQYRRDYAVFARIRLGSSSLINSMGLENFAYCLYDDPDLVKAIHLRFSEWFVKTLQHLNQMDFDFYVLSDDLADTKAPFMSPRMYREFFLPYQKMVAEAIKRPWVFHSDGNLMPIMDDLLSLGMNAIHPIQPGAMNIEELKTTYGKRVCLVGNIDLDYTLTLGTPEEVDQQVKERMAVVAPGGRYIISSSNSITSYCKPENVLAMAEAIRKYGKY